MRSAGGSGFVWDESSLVLERKGDRLTMWDANVERLRQNDTINGFAWSPVIVEFKDFYDKMSQVKAEYLNLCNKLLDAINEKGYPKGTQVAQQAVLAQLHSLGYKPRASDDDIPLKCAIIREELEAGLTGIS